MAKLFGIFVCLLIVALDSIAGILGIKAEAAQNQVSLSTSYNKLNCYDRIFTKEIQHLLFIYNERLKSVERNLSLIIFDLSLTPINQYIVKIQRQSLHQFQKLAHEERFVQVHIKRAISHASIDMILLNIPPHAQTSTSGGARILS